MLLDDLYEIMSWEPIAELDQFRLSVRVQVVRVVFTICVKAMLDGTLDREAARERNRERVLTELARAFGKDVSGAAAYRRGPAVRTKWINKLSETTKIFSNRPSIWHCMARCVGASPRS